MAIIVKNNEAAEYPYIFKCKQYDYRMHKNRVLLAHNQGSTLSADRDPTKAIVMYNFWRGHWLIIVTSKQPRHFRLEVITYEQLLAMNNM